MRRGRGVAQEARARRPRRARRRSGERERRALRLLLGERELALRQHEESLGHRRSEHLISGGEGRWLHDRQRRLRRKDLRDAVGTRARVRRRARGREGRGGVWEGGIPSAGGGRGGCTRGKKSRSSRNAATGVAEPCTAFFTASVPYSARKLCGAYLFARAHGGRCARREAPREGTRRSHLALCHAAVFGPHQSRESGNGIRLLEGQRNDRPARH